MRHVRQIAIVALVLAATASTAQTPPAEAELKTLLNHFLAAASHSPASAEDKKTFDHFFADDVLYTRSAGVLTNKREIMKSFDEPPAKDPRQGAFSAEDVAVHQYGEFAVVAFKLVQKLDDGTRNEFRNTGTFQKRDRRWQVIAWQATRVPKETQK